MAAAALNYTATPARTSAPFLPILTREIRYEFLKLLRAKSFSLAVIGFPLMFYTLFGIANRHAQMGEAHVAKYMLGGYACFGLVGAALFGIGVGLASEKAAGWLELKRASPMPPLAYLLAKIVTAQAFGLIIVSILTAAGLAFGNVHLTGLEFVRMMALTLAGAIPFACMGLLLALVIPANAAPGVVNLIYLPMSFVSGLWVPIQFLPRLLQRVAHLLPTYHLAQLMEGAFGRGYTDGVAASTHWLGLASFTCLALGGAWAVFQRAEKNA